MKKVLSIIIVLILFTFSFSVLAEPDDTQSPPSVEDTSEPSVPEETTPPEIPQQPQPEQPEDTSQPEESSSAQPPFESQDTSSEETPSEDDNSSEGTVSAPVINSNTPTNPQSSEQTSSQDESNEESAITSAKTKIYSSNALIIISGSENAFSKDTIIKTTSITDGNEYSNASLALANSTSRFMLYSFTNESGEQPTEKLNVSFSIPALYDIDKVAIYKIGEGASATKLVHKTNKKTAKITVQIDSLGTYAIAQLFEPVNTEKDTLNVNTQKEIFVIICACVLIGLATVTTTVLIFFGKRK